MWCGMDTPGPYPNKSCGVWCDRGRYPTYLLLACLLVLLPKLVLLLLLVLE